MTRAPDYQPDAGEVQSLAVETIGLGTTPFVFWARSSCAVLRSAIDTQDELLAFGRDLADALVAQPRESAPDWPVISQRAWQTVLEWWVTIPARAERQAQDLLLELSFGSRELLQHLGQEQAARQQVEQERDRWHSQAARERAERAMLERERDAQRTRADSAQAERRRLERDLQRLEHDLRRKDERLGRAEHERGQLRQQVTQEKKARQQLERALAKAEQGRVGTSTRPAVNVQARGDEWAVVRDEAKRASGLFPTKREAVQRAREIARHEGVDVHINPAERNGVDGDRPVKQARPE